MTLFLRTIFGLGCFHPPVSSPWFHHTIHNWGNATDPSYQCRYMFKRSRLGKRSTVSHPLSYIVLHFSWPPPWIIFHRSFSHKSLAPFRVTDVRFIKALLWRITSCRHQLIIREDDLGTPLSVLWSLHASMAGFSLPAIGIHQWPSTRRFCVVFDAKSFIHTTWIVLQYLEGHCHYWWFLSRLLTVYINDR